MQRIVSGDQGVLWDASLKLRALAYLGYRVQHQVHSADILSRPDRTNGKPWKVVQEAYRPDGNVNRWAATLEAATFLGMRLIAPARFISYGVDFPRIARFLGTSEDAVVADFTQSDWTGITHHKGDRVAHCVRVRELRDVLASFLRPLRENICTSVESTHQKDAARAFDRLTAFNEFPDEPLAVAAARLLSRDLQDRGVNGAVSVTTSFDLFSASNGLPRLLTLFVEQYDKARIAYNEAVQDNGTGVKPLAVGELPFYAIVRDAEGHLVRRDLCYTPGDTVPDVMRRFVHQAGEPEAVLGKALMHLAELRLSQRVILPEGGSVYTPQSIRFTNRLQELVPGILGQLHPILRLKMHALDALREVNARILLPQHLKRAFAREWITGKQFALDWRDVVAEAQQKADRLTGNDFPVVAQQLVADGYLDAGTLQLIRAISGRFDEYEKQVKDTSAEAQRRAMQLGQGLADRERRSHIMAQARDTRESLHRSYDADLLKTLAEHVVAMIDARRAAALRQYLGVTTLGYWDNRPFATWVNAVPGWGDAIMRRAEVLHDPLTPESEVA